MILREWENLPVFLRLEEVRPYYDILYERRGELAVKRIFDFFMAGILLIILAVPMAGIALIIRMDSPGTVFYRQERITAYGKKFRIHKFRTMIMEADRFGTQVTVMGDTRVTRVGTVLRKYRLDELPQLIDVLNGSMSFVGTRPEVPKYVERYTRRMRATLLLPAGITSEASVRYKDEAQLLDGAEDVDQVYVEKVLPGKMKWNLWALERFSLWNEVKVLGRTVAAVMRRD
ncbi:sugar transferase [Acetatifactor muris]|uniref:UDP-N-acetylgalactosamine-undecaprenyl-phosphate N-acetylgalactosaminephosphotransferase n=1 Tax=Acetatifactor muris TaxID=879566 RepID=A0A2K4ZJW1_9FIRM|nr:sugar transferase [Acetatifactor muris]MCR2049094.1 sugar transferase [Acetatifactor muris]SOY30761.1 UDP-N-acetylgalactosamine-undecaprenyl-phosphate N-acetylgalactosaminephosphotransferase [Acetatifactor muris]